MRPLEVLGLAWRNLAAARVRTLLTVLAVVVGAATLTLTTGVGVGIRGHLDATVAAVGRADELHVRKADPVTADAAADPSAPVAFRPGAGAGVLGPALTSSDLQRLRRTPGVESVEVLRSVDPTYVAGPDGRRWEIDLDPSPVPPAVDQGRTPDARRAEIVVPRSWVGSVVPTPGTGSRVTLAVTTSTGKVLAVPAVVSGVLREQESVPGAPVASPRLLAQLDEAQQSTTVAAARSWAMATVKVTDARSVPSVVESLEGQGYSASTLEEELGLLGGIVTVVVAVFSAFGAVTLLAGALGIVNALVMSTHERTREIGLLKALGLGSGGVFALFSAEAALLGVLGSCAGVLAGVGLGVGVSHLVTATTLHTLPASALFGVDAAPIAAIVVGVALVALLSGTAPALRAARRQPVAALRHE